MAPWEQQPNDNWHLYDDTGNVVDTRARNPDISPQETMLRLLDNMPAATLAEMAAFAAREAAIQLDKAREMTRMTLISLHSAGTERDVASSAVSSWALADAYGTQTACGDSIATASVKIHNASELLGLVQIRWRQTGAPSTDNEKFVTEMFNECSEKVKLMLELTSFRVTAGAAVRAARGLAVQHPDFGGVRDAAFASVSEMSATLSDPRYQLRPLAEALTTGSREIPSSYIHGALPRDLVIKMGRALSRGVFIDSKPYGEQGRTTTTRNAQATQAVITLLKEAGMSDHQMARDAYHARQQHRGEVFPAVGLYPENSWSGHAGSQSIGNPSGQPTTDVATTSHQRATTPPARPHRR
ncbi:hypothetical protein ACLQ25_00320 [Micromonospora sp. DT44]|uniref:hypothetical protein n=1 Tax=Micromonospora sp. DT44 TaxID=3393439 RepID=UPI003CF1F531